MKTLKEERKMLGKSGFAKCMGAGIMLGLVGSVVGGLAYSNNKKSFKKQAGKAVKAMGDFMDNVHGMMK